jgi:hypothetical protein
MQRHTLYVNNIPAVALGGNPGLTLDPQECFNKALKTVAALRPISETAAIKTYTPAELRRLRAACSLNITEMESALPDFHEQLLTKGRTKKGTDSALAQALRPQGDNNDPGLVYVSAELVSDVEECKYRLGWDTSYRNCHRGISPFAVPHMSMKHQQERDAYQDRLRRATTTTLGTSRKARATPVQRRKTTMDFYNYCPTTSAYLAYSLVLEVPTPKRW